MDIVLSQRPTQGKSPLLTFFSCCSGKTNLVISQRRNTAMGLARYPMADAHALSRDKRIPIAPKKNKERFPHRVINPAAQAVWALCLLVRKCYRPRAHSSASVWGPRTAGTKLLSSTPG